MFYYMIKQLLEKIELLNGEGQIKLDSVRVHETETGYAEAFEEDLSLAHFTYSDVKFSESIKESWKSLS